MENNEFSSDQLQPRGTAQISDGLNQKIFLSISFFFSLMSIMSLEDSDHYPTNFLSLSVFASLMANNTLNKLVDKAKSTLLKHSGFLKNKVLFLCYRSLLHESKREVQKFLSGNSPNNVSEFLSQKNFSGELRPLGVVEQRQKDHLFGYPETQMDLWEFHLVTMFMTMNQVSWCPIDLDNIEFCVYVALCTSASLLSFCGPSDNGALSSEQIYSSNLFDFDTIDCYNESEFESFDSLVRNAANKTERSRSIRSGMIRLFSEKETGVVFIKPVPKHPITNMFEISGGFKDDESIRLLTIGSELLSTWEFRCQMNTQLGRLIINREFYSYSDPKTKLMSKLRFDAISAGKYDLFKETLFQVTKVSDQDDMRTVYWADELSASELLSDCFDTLEFGMLLATERALCCFLRDLHLEYIAMLKKSWIKRPVKVCQFSPSHILFNSFRRISVMRLSNSKLQDLIVHENPFFTRTVNFMHLKFISTYDPLAETIPIHSHKFCKSIGIWDDQFSSGIKLKDMKGFLFVNYEDSHNFGSTAKIVESRMDPLYEVEKRDTVDGDFTFRFNPFSSSSNVSFVSDLKSTSFYDKLESTLEEMACSTRETSDVNPSSFLSFLFLISEIRRLESRIRFEFSSSSASGLKRDSDLCLNTLIKLTSIMRSEHVTDLVYVFSEWKHQTQPGYGDLALVTYLDEVGLKDLVNRINRSEKKRYQESSSTRGFCETWGDFVLSFYGTKFKISDAFTKEVFDIVQGYHSEP